MAFRINSLSAKETAIWSYPQLFNSKKGLLRLSRTSIKEDWYLLNDGETIVVLLGKIYKDNCEEFQGVEGVIRQVVDEFRYNGGVFQNVVVVRDKACVSCV